MRRAPNVGAGGRGWNAEVVGKMRIPALFVAAAHDKQVPLEGVRTLHSDYGAQEKVFVDLACTSHNALWERNHLLLFRASLEWFSKGTVNGAPSGSLRLGDRRDNRSMLLAAASVIVAFGDSITEGYGVARGQDYPAQLERALAARGVKVKIVNAGVSGDTTNNALDRLASVIAVKPALVLVEFGGNDGLRGFPPEVTRKNLSELIVRLQKGGSRVALIGMTLPKNYGSGYLKKFERVYTDLAAEHKVTLIPVTPAAVLGGAKGLMQSDGIHPTAAGYKQFVTYLLPFVEKEIRTR